VIAADSNAVSRSPRRPWWRFFTQFSLRSLLLLVTAASVACWWFLQPQMREEQFEQTPLRVRRQIRLVKSQPPGMFPPPSHRLEFINGHYYEAIDAGHWRLFDQRGNLLVDGRYENNLEHGWWTTYHVNGRKAAEGRMLLGEKVGQWRTWDESGRLISDAVY
jgi:hypothetical protein